MRFMIIVVLLVIVSEATVRTAQARRYRQNRVAATAPQPAPERAGNETPARPAASETTATKSVDDALSEVNAARAKQGLRPFLPDPLLNQAARKCARIRATNLIDCHLPSDFEHLPAGALATAAGCGALEPSWGWGTCCTYDNYTYAGAAWVMGTDGKRYMHLFVR